MARNRRGDDHDDDNEQQLSPTKRQQASDQGDDLSKCLDFININGKNGKIPTTKCKLIQERAFLSNQQKGTTTDFVQFKIERGNGVHGLVI